MLYTRIDIYFVLFLKRCGEVPWMSSEVCLGSFIADFLRNFMKLCKSETSWNFNGTSMKLFQVFFKLRNFQSTKKIQIKERRKRYFRREIHNRATQVRYFSKKYTYLEIFSGLVQKKEKAPPYTVFRAMRITFLPHYPLFLASMWIVSKSKFKPKCTRSL